MIVDALVDYKHPVFVYIPPNGELRGGAWVVIDPTINEEVCEYSNVWGRPFCRFSVLEFDWWLCLRCEGAVDFIAHAVDEINELVFDGTFGVVVCNVPLTTM